MFDFAEKTENMSAIEILNYYRNLYYAEPQVTERGIVANTINDVLNLVNRQKAEIEELKNYVNRCKSGKEYRVKCLLEKPNEALKKFAERMRECCAYNNDLSADAYLSVTTDINCVLKEMVGEEE